MKFRSPLSIAVGSGSAKHGFSHWWLQRVSAIALIPLTLWFVFSMVCLSASGYAEAVAWLSSPINAAIMLLFTLTALLATSIRLKVVGAVSELSSSLLQLNIDTVTISKSVIFNMLFFVFIFFRFNFFLFKNTLFIL